MKYNSLDDFKASAGNKVVASASSLKKKIIVGFSVLTFLALGISSTQLVENLEADKVMVIQTVMGDLETHVEPGPKLQLFGKVTKYPRQAQYSFCSVEGQGLCPDAQTSAKRLRFNDGGHANLSGAVIWEMPLDRESILNIHKKFGSPEGVESRAVGKMLDAAVYLAGPLMSSTESSGSRRAELVNYINDQAENGVYATQSRTEITKDAAGKDVTTSVTEILKDKDGNYKRQQGSILSEFNIKLLPLSISELKYDPIVEKQIAERQEATTRVQIARADAAKAEQDAITAAAKGQADAAKAKWEQETIKAKEVTLAQQKLEVAELAAKEAAQYKRQQILMGEGEAERKRLVMEADGALDPKLKAYIEVNKNYAVAIQNYAGNWVPGVVMGGDSKAHNQNGAQALVEMLTAKTAKELAIDMTMSGQNQTKAKK